MSEQQLIKQYSLKQLEDICKDYRYVSLQDINGNIKQTWNGVGAKYADHFKTCIKRFNSQALEDGFYYFCFTSATRLMKNPDKFLVCKGDSSKAQTPTINLNHLGSTAKENNALTFSEALGYITQIANLTADNKFLQAENERLKKEVAVLEAEIEVLESTQKGVGEAAPTPSGLETYLKETSPLLLSLADKYLTQRDKKLELEEKQLILAAQDPAKKRTVLKIETASPEHLNLIRSYAKNNDDTGLNIELDKLEAANPELYKQICVELNISENE